LKQKTQARLTFCLALLFLWPTSCPSAFGAATPEGSTLSSHDLLTRAYEQICKGSFEDAVPTLCQVVRSDRNSPTARRYLAFVLLQKGQGKEALAQLDALNQLQPTSATFDILLRGVANDMVGQREKALGLFREAMAREPQSDYYRIKTVDELILLLQYDEAEKIALEGYNSAKDPKVSAIYQQKIKKVRSILRLTGRRAAR
jgi:tetratricopeptide (TPR) repeat protein